MRRSLSLAVSTVVLGAVCAGGPLQTAGAAPPKATCGPLPAADTGSAVGWIGYLGQHRNNVALVIDGGRGGGLSHRADVAMPTASMAKIIHLAALSAEVAAKRVSLSDTLPLSQWQKHYVTYEGQPLDGGMHIEALKYLNIPAKDGVPIDLSGTITLAQLADVMIRFSDSAAPDALRAHLGDAALQAVADRYAITGPLPSFRALYQGLIASGATTVDEVHAHAARTYSGRASSFARLIGDIGTGHFGAGSETARRFLEQSGASPQGLSALGFKGGSLPGVLTEAFEGRRSDGTVAVAVLMVRGLSGQDAQRDIAAAMPHQGLLVSAMTDSKVRAQLSCALGR